ncbi:DUF1127 domain-containing protein [Rhizobium sp. TRM95111]|uniref:DUF1127 domain-containing protein n=1 Tax=Rhizobium alarense TaxID=2846851 RepID=UPI001F21C116|nr:DUF1127 domain-containing protein [Rhizobium alarense]MCF3642506.1 DUF1127 domain-containing protein [Rhizobium alarense]
MRMMNHRLDLDLAVSAKPAPTFSVRLRNAASRLVRAWLNRAAVLQLQDLDDHQLLDLGLRREDVTTAMTSAFFSDPGLHLTITARERARRHLRNGRLD